MQLGSCAFGSGTGSASLHQRQEATVELRRASGAWHACRSSSAGVCFATLFSAPASEAKLQLGATSGKWHASLPRQGKSLNQSHNP